MSEAPVSVCKCDYASPPAPIVGYNSTMLRKVLYFSWLPVLCLLGYTGWVMYDRAADNRGIEAQQQRNRAKEDAAIVEKLGGGELKVVAFYANPPVVRSGARGLLCYGVVNAKTVRMDPPVQDVGPALSRCVEVQPMQTTTYTLIAEDEKGREARSTASIGVQER